MSEGAIYELYARWCANERAACLRISDLPRLYTGDSSRAHLLAVHYQRLNHRARYAPVRSTFEMRIT